MITVSDVLFILLFGAFLGLIMLLVSGLPELIWRHRVAQCNERLRELNGPDSYCASPRDHWPRWWSEPTDGRFEKKERRRDR